MIYTVTFEVEKGKCELYKNFKDRTCKICPLRCANYCIYLNMHNAKVITASIIKPCVNKNAYKESIEVFPDDESTPSDITHALRMGYQVCYKKHQKKYK